MIDRKVGVVTSHNAPSSLSPVEKAARARRRRLERDINLLTIRICRFSGIEQIARNPVKRATAQAEVEKMRRKS